MLLEAGIFCHSLAAIHQRPPDFMFEGRFCKESLALSFRPRPRAAWRNLAANERRLPFAAKCLGVPRPRLRFAPNEVGVPTPVMLNEVKHLAYDREANGECECDGCTLFAGQILRCIAKAQHLVFLASILGCGRRPRHAQNDKRCRCLHFRHQPRSGRATRHDKLVRVRRACKYDIIPLSAVQSAESYGLTRVTPWPTCQ
jgi:hypothetical protein